MKLRNKKTGEIIEFDAILPVKDVSGDSVAHLEYGSLAELNEEWEDYEEPKTFFTIYYDGTISEFKDGDDGQIRDMKAIGNYFDTREEAEKAVRKLKALKRLKDEGMRIYSFHKEKIGIDLDFYTITILAPRDKDSLGLLFGGEE